MTLLAAGDNLSIPYGKPLQVEALGVLENNTLDGEAAGENDATAKLLSGIANGTMCCPADAMVTQNESILPSSGGRNDCCT